MVEGLAAAGIHRADALELYAIDRALIAELCRARSTNGVRGAIND